MQNGQIVLTAEIFEEGEEFLRQWGKDLQCFAGCRMYNGGSEGMEGITGKTGQWLSAVAPVSPDRVADKFEMLPDLMHATGDRVNRQ